MIYVLHEIEDVELFQCPIREETVHRILHIVEKFKSDGQSTQQEQLQMLAIEVQQRQSPTDLRSLGRPNTSVPRQVLSTSVTSLRFQMIFTFPD